MDRVGLAFEEIELMRVWLSMSARKRRSLLTGFLITLIVAVLPVKRGGIHSKVVFAQAVEEWSEPVLLSTNTVHSWFADVAVDGQGRVHVVWDSGIPPRSLDDPGLSLTMYSVRDLDGSWSEPNDIATGDSAELSRPAIALDRAGLLHMAFRPSGIVYYSQANSRDAHSAQAWRYPHRLSTSEITYMPGIAVDSQGIIHVVWCEWVPVELSEEEIFRDHRSPYLSDIFYRRSADGGTTWSAPLNLSRTPNVGSGRVQIKIDAQDVIHVTWEEGWDRNAQNDVAGASPVCGMYVHSLDGGYTWSTPKVLDMPRTVSVHSPDAYSRYETGLRQLLSRIDRDHSRYSEALVYQRWLIENISETREESDSDTPRAQQAILTLEAERATIMGRLNELALSVVGKSFDALCDLSTSTMDYEPVEHLPQADNTQMTLGLDNDGGVLLVWRSRELKRLYYTWSEDGGITWGSVEQVPGIYARPWNEPYDAYDAASDSMGHIHVVMVATTVSPEIEERNPPLGVYHLTWDGKSWSEPQLIAHYPEPSIPEYPKIAVGQGNHLHVVWGLRPEGIWEHDMQIWYSELEISAPLEEPALAPTPTAAPTMTPTPALVPTATPFPTLGPEGSGVPEGLYTEQDDLAWLALALSPVLLVMMILIAIKWVRRKWLIQ